jgi:hypothetical protein
MSSHYKAFAVVIFLTTMAFWLAKPVFLNFMTQEDFVRRRNLWLALTSSAFLVPGFWLHMAVAAVLIWTACRKDSNPAALWFFLLLAVPPIQQVVPGFGLFTYAFTFDHFRLLSLALAVPAVLRMRNDARGSFQQSERTRWLAPDIFLVAYVLLPIALSFSYSSSTAILRSVFLAVIDLLLPYYLISRSCGSKKLTVEVIAAFALSAMVLAPLAIFESASGWLLYAGMPDNWSVANDSFGYLLRGSTLRAQVTSGQSIVLGYFFAVVLGLWLYLQARLAGWRRWLGTAGVIGGLGMALSRGPWVGAVICVVAFFALGPGAKTGILKLITVSLVLGAVTVASPWGSAIVDLIPFVGSVDVDSISYRQAMNDRSWLLIQQNPFFGSPYFLSNMEDLRTGYGVIDLLNGYLTIALSAGLVTLGAFLLFFATAAIRCMRTARIHAAVDPDTSRLGAALVASLIGALVTLYTVSSYLSIPYIYVGLAGLMVAYSRVRSDVQVPASHRPQGASPVGVSRLAPRSRPSSASSAPLS